MNTNLKVALSAIALAALVAAPAVAKYRTQEHTNAQAPAYLNDMVIQNVVVIPVLWRNGVSAAAARLQGLELSGWDVTLWRLSHWYRQT